MISVKECLPEAVHGEEGQPPIISDDVLAYWPGAGFDIANYDHEDNAWSLVNHGFDWADNPPTHWMPLPEPPK